MTAPDSQETTERPEKEWRFTILHAFALSVVFLILQGVIILVIRQTTGLKIEELRWFHLSIISAISGSIVLGGGAYLNGFSVHDMLMDHLPDAGQILSTVVAVLGLVILSSELNNILLKYFPLNMGDQAELIQRLIKEDLIGVIITIAVVAPIIEELLFRGVILDGLRMHYRLSTAVVASSILFGLVHLSPIVSIQTCILALFLAWLRVSTGSLMLCVISHSVFNATPFILMRISDAQIQGFTTVPTAVVQFQPLWLDVLGLFLLLAGIAGLKFAGDEQEEQQEVHQN
ncbi:MAG TPA: CPBP family intramembrane glutamic endopeptidase [Acidobacteriota bacterium]|nr:CPBP family intramembrane glutamic endopeptidase [Acidobacteriota bacterium]